MYNSKLHQIWADFFNENNIEFCYKDIAIGKKGKIVYPDFYLPKTDLRNDKRGVYLIISAKEEIKEDFKGSQINLVEFIGSPIFNMFDDKNNGKGIQHSPFWDNCMAFRICEKCDCSKIDFLDNNNDVCSKCNL